MLAEPIKKPVQPLSDKGEVFESDGHTIIHGDTIALLNTAVPDGSVDLVFADPPYNIGKRFGAFADRWPDDDSYVEWCQQWLEVCAKKLKSTGSLYVMTSTQAMPYLDLFLRRRMHVLSRIVWHYDSSGVQARRYFGSLYEPIIHCVVDPAQYTFNAEHIAVEAKTGAVRRLIDYRKPTPTVYNSKKVPGNAWYFSRVRYRMDEYEDHPSQKPESLLERVILASSNPGDLVLDPFAGTFTTCAVAKRLGRRSIGIELNSDYVEIGLRRLGIANELNGKSLLQPKKSFQRRNGLRRPAQEKTLSLFGEEEE
jgi:site-specific DNA-methyltransferase (adenine-specific)